MAISLPRHLPARRILAAEGLQVVSQTGLSYTQLAPLRIALLNLMPKKSTTETQIGRLLAAAPYPVDLTLFVPEGYVSKTTPPAYLQAHYTPWRQVCEQHFDGLIVTGAPVEHLPFEEVSYWQALTEILDWSRSRHLHSFFICWAAQAALYHFHGVPKHALTSKLFGLYEQTVVQTDHALLRGFGASFRTPVSRHTEIRRTDLPAGAGLSVLAESVDAGLCLIADASNTAAYMFNHLEYDATTLQDEYKRDLHAGKTIQPPRHYFADANNQAAPLNTWRSAGQRLFRNWLRQIVEQRPKSFLRHHSYGSSLNPALPSTIGI